MNDKNQRSPSVRTNMASCEIATIFLIFTVVIILIAIFVLFQPKSPKIAISTIQIPSFSISNTATANFTFSQYISVKNPNKSIFFHFNSSLQLLYSGTGRQIGFMYIPAGEINAGRTQYMAATFDIQSLPLTAVSASEPILINGFNGGIRVGQQPTVEVESKMDMAGRVRVLHFFTHHVNAKVECRVTIAGSDGSVLGFHC